MKATRTTTRILAGGLRSGFPSSHEGARNLRRGISASGPSISMGVNTRTSILALAAFALPVRTSLSRLDVDKE